jgi:RNA polymerase-binding transcription factor DksA
LSYTSATVHQAELGPEELAVLRARLHDERRFRLEQLDSLSETWPSRGNLSAGQHAKAREEVLTVLAAAAQLVLTDVDAALSRMDTGRYGSCHLCDRHIPLASLRILPHARYCGPCHQLKESVSWRLKNAVS